MNLIELIEASYSVDEASRHRKFGTTQSQIEAVVALGKEILLNVPAMEGACTVMSALWTARIRDKLGFPAFCVAGNLIVEGKVIWGDASTTEQVAGTFVGTTFDWDGHCWVCIGDYVADLSIFRTAYSDMSPPHLREFVLRHYGKGRGMMIANSVGLADDGLAFVPKYVLGEAQLNGLISGFGEILRLSSLG